MEGWEERGNSERAKIGKGEQLREDWKLCRHERGREKRWGSTKKRKDEWFSQTLVLSHSETQRETENKDCGTVYNIHYALSIMCLFVYIHRLGLYQWPFRYRPILGLKWSRLF